MCHEHILDAYDFPSSENPDGTMLNDTQLAIREVSLYKKQGEWHRARTLVEVSSYGLRQSYHAERLQEISYVTGVNIILGTGFYKQGWLHGDWKTWWKEDTLTEITTRELLIGIVPTDIRAGLIGEIGIQDRNDTNHIDVHESTLLRAVARAHLQTGAPISLHFEADAWWQDCINPSVRTRVTQYLIDQGVRPDRILVGHCSPTAGSRKINRELLNLGAFIAFDMFGEGVSQSNLNEFFQVYVNAGNAIRELLSDNEGFRDRILLSQDVWSPARLYSNGGCGYAHLIRDVCEQIFVNQCGLDAEDQLRRMIMDNPQAFLAWST